VARGLLGQKAGLQADFGNQEENRTLGLCHLSLCWVQFVTHRTSNLKPRLRMTGAFFIGQDAELAPLVHCRQNHFER